MTEAKNPIHRSGLEGGEAVPMSFKVFFKALVCMVDTG